MLRFLTAGESHGQGLIAVLEGMPAGLALDLDAITIQLRRRQGGYGRGRRMAIESDRAEILSGVRRSKTTGGPIALLIPNKDWQNWQKTMHVEAEMPEAATGASRAPVTRPRPGHADLAGALKYGHDDIRDVLERASARETAARVALGALARQLIGRFDIEVMSHVTRIGSTGIDESLSIDVDRIRAIPDDSPLHCADLAIEQQMIAAIDAAKEAGDTLGGSFEVVVTGLPVGLGSYVQWDRKLDGRLAQAIMSIPAIKAVGIGKGPDVARLPGSRIHDEIVPAGDRPSGHPAVGLSRLTNNAGGLEGGVTNGEQLRVTGYMKPIATLMQPLRSVDLATMTESPAAIERSDVCAVTAAAVVGEAMVALTVADAFLEKFGNDNITDIAKVVAAAVDSVRTRFAARPAPAPARS
jgi:chorismate synthase